MFLVCVCVFLCCVVLVCVGGVLLFWLRPVVFRVGSVKGWRVGAGEAA